DHHGVAGDSYSHAELVPRLRVGGLEVRLLAPEPATAHEDVGRPRLRGRVVALVPVHPGASAGLVLGADHHGVAVDSHADAKDVPWVRIGCFEVRLLGPDPPGAHEDVRRAGTGRAVVELVPVDPCGRAVVVGGSHHHGVPRDGHAHAETVPHLR